MRATFHSSNLDQNGTLAFLRFFYITWNIIGTIIIFGVIYLGHTKSIQMFNYMQKSFLYIIVCLIITFISYLFGVKGKFWLMGIIVGDDIKSKIPWQVFIIALISQMIPVYLYSIWDKIPKHVSRELTASDGIMWGSFALGISLIWLSGRFIKFSSINKEQQVTALV